MLPELKEPGILIPTNNTNGTSTQHELSSTIM